MTSKEMFYPGLPVYEWETDDFEGDTFLNALSLITNTKGEDDDNS
jgi:hypothetical protein